MKKEELEAIADQILTYKFHRKTLQFGTFYRGRTFLGETSCLRDGKGNIMEWTCVSQGKNEATGVIIQKMVVPNTAYQYYKAKGLDPNKKYIFTNQLLKYNIKNFGGLVNMVSPIHIKQDSIIHNIAAKLVKMDGETEEYHVYGDILMYNGVRLKQGFSGTGYNNETRYFQDFDSRMYFMTEGEKE